MKKIILLVGAALALATLPAPAQAADPAPVHLDVDLAGMVALADCDVTVPGGADGIAVLDAAVADGCIDSYSTQVFFGARYVDCINDLCEQPAAFPTVTWLMTLEGGGFAPVGIEELSFPADGGELRFTYEAWPVHAPCLIFGIACP